MQNIPILGTKIAPCFALLDFRRGCCFFGGCFIFSVAVCHSYPPANKVTWITACSYGASVIILGITIASARPSSRQHGLATHAPMSVS